MESTFTDNGQERSADFKARTAKAADIAAKARQAGGQEVNNLISDVQDLLSRLSHIADPEIAQMRVKVTEAVAAAKKTLSDGTDQVQRQAKRAITAGDGYVRDQPWQAVGIAAAAGLVIGFLVARR
jgi:ElaB/YqjD/DUF883 family membrane-anchored ribosome-binding protein